MTSRDLSPTTGGPLPAANLEAAPSAADEAVLPVWFSNLREANEARQVEWTGGQKVTPLFRATELAGEVGEACNVVKKLERERAGWRGSRATLEQLADELADVIICADLLAMSEGIDLDAAVARKFNATSEKVGLRTRLTGKQP
jgi:NTP pyrophosphatase (non-canonical NTP hydrolase)